MTEQQRETRVRKRVKPGDQAGEAQAWIHTLQQLWLRTVCQVLEQVAGMKFEIGSMSETGSERSLSVRSEFNIGGDFRGQLVFGIPASSREFTTLLLPEKDGGNEEKSWDDLSATIADQWLTVVLQETGLVCRAEHVDKHAEPDGSVASAAGVFCTLTSPRISLPVCLSIRGELANPSQTGAKRALPTSDSSKEAQQKDRPAFDGEGANLDLLLDIELQASLRFGGREMSLHEILDLGPGDVVPLDRTVQAPVDLVVGDRIVARGEVVLVDGNYGLRVTEVAEPRKRLETVRCLF
jgi:flagellar motor switch protein FliN/FliY